MKSDKDNDGREANPNCERDTTVMGQHLGTKRHSQLPLPSGHRAESYRFGSLQSYALEQKFCGALAG